MPFRCRFARRSDFPGVLPLLAMERPLFDSEIWALLPELLPDLLERRRVHGAVIDDLQTGRPAFFGMTGFAHPSMVGSLLSTEAGRFRSAILRQEACRKPVLLSPKQLPLANGAGDLALLHLAGSPDEPDFTKPRGYELHRMAFSFFTNVHAGYRISEFWQENMIPEAGLYMESMGMTQVRAVDLEGGGVARLFRFTREDSILRPGTQLAYLMKYPPPRLGFTPAQQRLLELAALDYADAAAAEEMGITLEAVRKRWRAIHARHPFGEGKDQRRALLAYIRQHPEELRPWQAPPAGTPST